LEISDESDQLLDTGGGLKKAGWFFDDGKPFLLHNVDVLSSLDLNEIYNDHLGHGHLATLAVSERITSRYLLFDTKGMLRGWENKSSGETKPPGINPRELQPYAFSGIHVIDPSIFHMIEEKGRFSLIGLYLRLCSKSNIKAHVHESGKWMDIGSPAALEQANKEIPNDFLY
jgi:NDP-sugar pyrophosphorylase family protein